MGDSPDEMCQEECLGPRGGGSSYQASVSLLRTRSPRDKEPADGFRPASTPWKSAMNVGDGGSGKSRSQPGMTGWDPKTAPARRKAEDAQDESLQGV